MRIPLMILPYGLCRRLASRMLGIGYAFSKIFRNLGKDLKEAGYDIEPEEYTSMAIVNSSAFFIIFELLFFYLFYVVQLKSLTYSLFFGTGASFGISFLMFFVTGKYPYIMAGKRGEKINKNLLFALKDLLLQVGSGVSLYNSIVTISRSNYGEVSEEFSRIVKKITLGMSVDEAIEIIAMESRSEYLRRAMWQVLNTVRAGASIEGALKSIISNLMLDQRAKIKDYAHELNLWSLMYMLFAVAIPTIGITMLIILSSFMGMNITATTLIVFLVFSFIVQFALIGFIKSRRPVIEF
jgi:flagellar protein FlaJ